MGAAGRCLLAAILLSSLPSLQAGATGSSFARSSANAMIDNFSGGKNLASALGLVTGGLNIGGELGKCNGSPGVSPTCDYIGWIAGCAVMGIILVPLVASITCCSICCGRRCKVWCQCCCKPCGEPNCGGSLPTREYQPAEGMAVMAVLLLLWVFILTFSAIGFGALQETAAEIDTAFAGVRGIATAPAEVRQEVQTKLDGIKVDIKQQVTDFKTKFAPMPQIKASVGGLRNSLSGLQGALEDLGKLVEGCVPGPAASCSQGDRLNWQRCRMGALSVSQVGVAITLSGNAGTNPTCKDPQTGNPRPCGCCQKCHELLRVVEQVLDSLPSDSKLSELDSSLFDDQQINRLVDDKFREYTGPLNDIDGALPLKESEVTRLQNDLGNINPIVSGVNCAVWLPMWLALIGILLALVLGRPGAAQEQARWGDMCWWFSFVLGCITFCLVCILFGISSIVAIPLNDTCELLPYRGGTSKELIDLIGNQPNVDTKVVTTVLDDCLLKADGVKGYFWGVIDIKRETLNDQLNAFRPSAFVKRTDIDRALDSTSYTNAFTANENNFKSFTASQFVSANQCPPSNSYTNCASEVSAYTLDLNSKIAAVTSASTAVETARGNTNVLSNSVKADLNKNLAEADKFVDTLGDKVWELGDCALLSNKYAGVTGPVCGLADIFTSVWACTMIVAFLWLWMFVAICFASKRWYQAREGFREEPYQFVDPTTGNGVQGHHNRGDLVNAFNNDKPYSNSFKNSGDPEAPHMDRINEDDEPGGLGSRDVVTEGKPVGDAVGMEDPEWYVQNGNDGRPFDYIASKEAGPGQGTDLNAVDTILHTLSQRGIQVITCDTLLPGAKRRADDEHADYHKFAALTEKGVLVIADNLEQYRLWESSPDRQAECRNVPGDRLFFYRCGEIVPKSQFDAEVDKTGLEGAYSSIRFTL